MTSLQITMSVVALLAGSQLLPQMAKAQAMFGCSGGVNERQVGTTMSGSVTVPLCVAVTPQAAPPSGVPSYTWVPDPVVMPRGWRPVYGAWVRFEVGRKPQDDGFIYDYVLSLGHEQPELAKAAVRDACRARRPLLDQQGTCEGHVISSPYVTVTQYPDVPYFGSQRGQYEVIESSRPYPQYLYERRPGVWEICFERVRPEGECAHVVARAINGHVPEQKRGNPRR